MTEEEKKALKKEKRQTIIGVLGFVSALILIIWFGSAGFYW